MESFQPIGDAHLMSSKEQKYVEIITRCSALTLILFKFYELKRKGCKVSGITPSGGEKF